MTRPIGRTSKSQVLFALNNLSDPQLRAMRDELYAMPSDEQDEIFRCMVRLINGVNNLGAGGALEVLYKLGHAVNVHERNNGNGSGGAQ